MSSASRTPVCPTGVVYRFNPYTALGESPVHIVARRRSVKTVPVPPTPAYIMSQLGQEEDGLSETSTGSFGSSETNSVRTHHRSNPSNKYNRSPMMPSYIQQHQAIVPPAFTHVPTVHNTTPFLSDQISVASQSQSEASMTINFPTSCGDIQGNAHRTLGTDPKWSSLSFVSFQDIAAHRSSYQQFPANTPTTKLFVGQVLHELGSQQLKRVFEVMCGCSVVSVLPHGPGCYFVEIPAAHFRSARQLNGRILFDVKGLWFAPDQDVAKEMQTYVYDSKQSLKAMRLPRSAMVVRR